MAESGCARCLSFAAASRRAEVDCFGGDHGLVRTFVWVDAWQQQCCGEHFAVGSTVSWSVVPQTESDPEWVNQLLGGDWARRVEYHQERHDEVERPAISGQVMSIRVVTCSRRAERQGTGTVLMPVPGSGRLRQVELADPWEPEPPEDKRDQESFDGWIVELEVSAPAM